MIVVAGHLCLDVIPTLPSSRALEPGALVETGPVSFSTGGAVANVGLSLAKLGLQPVLVAKIGDDPFGEILRSKLADRAGSASEAGGVSAARGESTSYSIVLNPPGSDRTFLHHPGCNDTFDPALLEEEPCVRAEMLHFGYPPLMKHVYQDGGKGLSEAFGKLRQAGVTVSLDMAMPDSQGDSGRVDWREFLTTVLPQVDLFLPSWEEVRLMLEPNRSPPPPHAGNLAETAQRLLDLGPALVGLKLGEQGLYLRTANAARVARAGKALGGTAASAGTSGQPWALQRNWASRELLSTNFEVHAQGTTGAGDATIAGLLAAIARALPFEEAASFASAVGACSVEGVDATEGVTTWDRTIAKLKDWRRKRPSIGAADWRRQEPTGVWLGQRDSGGVE